MILACTGRVVVTVVVRSVGDLTALAVGLQRIAEADDDEKGDEYLEHGVPCVLAFSLLLEIGLPKSEPDRSLPQPLCGLCEVCHSYRPLPVPEPMPIAVLVSGAGTNLQALLDTVHPNEARIVAVASSTPGAQALERAAERGVPTRVFARADYRERGERDRAMADWLIAQGVQLVVLAGYMELLDAVFLDRFPGAVINVHPSLLPAFPGLRAVEQALAYGVKVFGVTVHLVDAGVDTGPVILQGAVELENPAGVEEVMDRIRPLEHELLPRAVRLFALGAVKGDPDDPRRIRTTAERDRL